MAVAEWKVQKPLCNKHTWPIVKNNHFRSLKNQPKAKNKLNDIYLWETGRTSVKKSGSLRHSFPWDIFTPLQHGYVKEKLHQTELSRQGRLYCRLLQKERNTEFIPTKTKGKRGFKHWSELVQSY